MKRICFHGAESTGKSVLAEKLAVELRLPWVPEYGREYAETFGTEFTLHDLLAIAEGHEARVRQLEAQGARLALLDTDPLMTAAWAEMLFGTVPPELLAYPKADLYLLFEADVPWIEDGTRFSAALPNAPALPPSQRTCWSARAYPIKKLAAPGPSVRPRCARFWQSFRFRCGKPAGARRPDRGCRR